MDGGVSIIAVISAQADVDIAVIVLVFALIQFIVCDPGAASERQQEYTIAQSGGDSRHPDLC